MAELTVDQQKAIAVARARAQAASSTDQSYQGSILPFSKDASGAVSFDSNAGLLGMAKSVLSGAGQAVTAPGRAMSGELQVMGPDGNVTSEAIGEGLNFAGFASPMSPGIRAGDKVVPGVASTFRKSVEAPTSQALRDASGRSYDALRDLGVDYSTASVNDLSGQIGTLLTQDGITPTLAPKTYSVLAGLAESPAGSVASLDGLTAARRAFGHAAADFANPTEQLAAKRAMESLDGFLSRPDPTAVVGGDASRVGPLLDDARGNYAAAKRSEQLSDLARAVELRANAANSGANVGNTTRQRIASFLLNKKQSAGFSPAEIDALEAVNSGSSMANITRSLGNRLGGGGGLGSLLTSGAGSIPGILASSPELTAAGAVALPAIGSASKDISNALTERALSQVGETVRKRSPLYEEMLKNAKSAPRLPEKTAAVVRALLLAQQSQDGGGGW